MKLAKNYNNHLINMISSNIPDMDKLVGHYRRYSRSDLARLFDKNK